MTGTAATLQRELIELFQTALNVDVPSPDTDLIATGRLDSMAMVELLLNLERRFGIVVDMRDLAIQDLRSVDAIAQFVARRRSNGGG